MSSTMVETSYFPQKRMVVSRAVRPILIRLIIIVSLPLLVVGGAWSQDAAPSRLKVGLLQSPPFVIQAEKKYSGMAIDLWEAIAAELQVAYTYEEFDDVRQLIDALSASHIDVAVTNLTITESRAERIDFTHPWFDAGLRVMVSEQEPAGFWSVMTGLKDSGHLRAYGWLALILLLGTLGFTIFNRRFDSNYPRRWRDGLAEGFYSVMSIAASGRAHVNNNYFGWWGRVGQGLWLVIGIGVVAYLTSSVTSVMTTLSLNNQITGVGDLPGRPVGILEGSSAEDIVREFQISPQPLLNIDLMIEALLRGDVDAVVGDTPVLEYYAYTHPDARLEVVGTIFHPDKYGFGLPLNSPLTRPLSVAVIGAHEDGVIEDIRTRYFGEND
jgi:polar amino acid transport system substrate-binding protein